MYPRGDVDRALEGPRVGGHADSVHFAPQGKVAVDEPHLEVWGDEEGARIDAGDPL